VIRVALGTGAVDYGASSLEPHGYARLLDLLFTDAKVNRPVRVQRESKRQIEARFARLGPRRLPYVSNFNMESVTLKIDGGTAPFNVLHELRDDRIIAGNQVTVPGRQTAIYELLQR
jgi:hypothetical protein